MIEYFHAITALIAVVTVFLGMAALVFAFGLCMFLLRKNIPLLNRSGQHIQSQQLQRVFGGIFQVVGRELLSHEPSFPAPVIVTEVEAKPSKSIGKRRRKSPERKSVALKS